MPSELPTSPGSFDCACSPLRDLHASLRMTDFVCVLSSSWLSSTSLCTPNNSSRTAELFPDLSPPACAGIFQGIPSTGTRVQQQLFPESASRGDNRSSADPRAIQNNRSHPDQAAIFNRATVQRD